MDLSKMTDDEVDALRTEVETEFESRIEAKRILSAARDLAQRTKDLGRSQEYATQVVAAVVAEVYAEERPEPVEPEPTPEA